MKLKHILILFLITTPLISKEVKIENAYIKYTSSATSVVYLTLNNGTNIEKKLVQAKSNIADRVELYTMLPSDAGMKMVPVSEISIPKNGMTSLTPRGYHIMLFGIKSPLKLKDSIPFRFIFSDGSELQSNISVETSSPNKDINNKPTSFKKEETGHNNNVSQSTDEADMSNFDPNTQTNEDHAEHDHPPKKKS